MEPEKTEIPEPLDPRDYIEKALIVPGQPHILLSAERSPGWLALRRAYEQLAAELARSNADLLLVYSTQWLSVIGHLFQTDPRPKWLHVDQNWYEFGEIAYEFPVDAEFGKAYSQEAAASGLTASTVNYHGFPVDTGTIVALKLLNPDNRLPASIVSCNVYSEREETILLGEAGARALKKQGKRAIAVCVTALSNRFVVGEIDPAQDRISSQKDDEWNRKVLDLLGEGRIEDVSQAARQFAREANADMRFRAIWWLAGLTGQMNRFSGKVLEYQPVWGTGAALVELTPADQEAVQHEFDEVRQLKPASQEVKASVRHGAGTAAPAAESPAAPKRVVGDGPIVSAHAAEPVGAYPHARRQGGLLFLSGIGPRRRGASEIPGVTLDASGRVASYDVEVQTRAVIDNLRLILEEAGSSLDKIIDVTIYLTNMARDFAVVNRVYAETFGAIQPTRTTIGVTALPTPIAVEFKVIALP
jgi:2-aminophenol/2-amino-5-chlorophenol 1,6-dioxygenase alpha subunit